MTQPKKDLKEDFLGTLRKIAQVLDEEIPDRCVIPQLTDMSVAPRAGIIGDWKNYFSKEALQMFHQE